MFATVPSLAGEPATDTTIVVRVDKSGDKYDCSVGGERLPPTTGRLPYAGLDQALVKRFAGRGGNQVVAVVIGRKVPFEDAFLARTAAHKVGYQTVRFFLANAEAGQMSEIVLGRQFRLPEKGIAGELVPVAR